MKTRASELIDELEKIADKAEAMAHCRPSKRLVERAGQLLHSLRIEIEIEGRLPPLPVEAVRAYGPIPAHFSEVQQ